MSDEAERQEGTMSRLYLLLPFLFLAAFALVVAGCSDDDDSGPTGPTGDSPVGSFVGVIQFNGYSSLASIPPTAIGLIGESFPITISSSLLLTVHADGSRETQTAQLTKQSDDSYTGMYQVTIGSAWVQNTYVLSYDSLSGYWKAAVTVEVDTDFDGSAEETGGMEVILNPRLNWSSYAGTWRAANSYDPAGVDIAVPQIETISLTADGCIEGAWFYNDNGTMRALIYDSGSDEAVIFEITSLSTTYMRVQVVSPKAPGGTVDPDPTNWTTPTAYIDAHCIPRSRLAAFVNDTVLTTVTDQIEHDTDGNDPEKEYPYFGADMVDMEIGIEVDTGGILLLTGGPDDLSIPYGYMSVGGTGYLAATWVLYSDYYFNAHLIVMELNASNRLTGNGILQGYDIPDLDQDGELDTDELLQIDNDGVLIFGDGINPDLFDFITSI
jgi:hypothetical protein